MLSKQSGKMSRIPLKMFVPFVNMLKVIKILTLRKSNFNNSFVRKREETAWHVERIGPIKLTTY